MSSARVDALHKSLEHAVQRAMSSVSTQAFVALFPRVMSQSGSTARFLGRLHDASAPLVTTNCVEELKVILSETGMDAALASLDDYAALPRLSKRAVAAAAAAAAGAGSDSGGTQGVSLGSDWQTRSTPLGPRDLTRMARIKEKLRERYLLLEMIQREEGEEDGLVSRLGEARKAGAAREQELEAIQRWADDLAATVAKLGDVKPMAIELMSE